MLEMRIKKILSQLFQLPIEMIDENTSAQTLSAWDSLAQMNLVSALEEAFNVQFTTAQMISMLSYTEILSAIRGMNSCPQLDAQHQ